MASFALFNVLVGLASFASGTPTTKRAVNLGPMALMEKISIPSQWVEAGDAASSTMLRMQIGIRQGNIKGLEEKLLHISNPESPEYGNWLTQEQIEKFTKPSSKSLDTVTAWLNSHDIHDFSHQSVDWIEVKVPVHKAEEMLNAKYLLYKDLRTGTVIPRVSEYSLPHALHDHVDLIQPTTAFLSNLAQSIYQNATSATPETASLNRRGNCDGRNITPDCIKSFYNVDYTGQGRALLGVSSIAGYAASHRDASTFLRNYAPWASNTDFAEVSIRGGSNNYNDFLEGNLDTQVALALGYPAQVNLYEMPYDNNDFGDQLLDLANYLNNNNNPPTAISTSYGIDEQEVNNNYLSRVCNEFMKAGSRGISTFFSSADFGVGGVRAGESCSNNKYIAVFPASCPYVTAVGGTGYRNGGDEVAAEYQFTSGPGYSGGGFSWYFKTPDYQRNDTNGYISGVLDQSWDGWYNKQGRGYPDISLLSELYTIVLNGRATPVSGTSAAAPAWAALISQINDYRKSINKPSLGFLNPLLYSKQGKSALRDITRGSNPGCNVAGFIAGSGWDAVTGLGSMDFGKFRQTVTNL
ncbi:hypothetical protein VHEMI00840 [[Torrubiella] hemipterigena]|uniref:Peptidase S53 domain-containing protein n=1 Tax=[Torrubiella] hemipterigena TaxID=1531966 RepID=A0A0A1T5S6_9HYPO|nr:hypothetical protein VHEMI00840 [[Torrubiella] hemipterigena]